MKAVARRINNKAELCTTRRLFTVGNCRRQSHQAAAHLVHAVAVVMVHRTVARTTLFFRRSLTTHGASAIRCAHRPLVMATTTGVHATAMPPTSPRARMGSTQRRDTCAVPRQHQHTRAPKRSARSPIPALLLIAVSHHGDRRLLRDRRIPRGQIFIASHTSPTLGRCSNNDAGITQTPPAQDDRSTV